MYSERPPDAYKNSNTHKLVNLGLGKGIDYTNGKFTVTDEYQKYDLNEQREVFDNHMYGLFHNPAVTDEAMKLGMMNLLYSQPFNPYKGVYDDLNDYMNDLSSMFTKGKK